MKKFYKFIYEKYIEEDWSFYTKIGKIFLYPFWLIRIPIVYIFSPLLIFDFFNQTNKKWISYKEKIIECFYDDLEKIKNFKK